MQIIQKNVEILYVILIRTIIYHYYGLLCFNIILNYYKFSINIVIMNFILIYKIHLERHFYGIY